MTRATTPDTLARIAADSTAMQPAPERPIPELDPDAYHGVVGEIVQRMAPHTESHPAALLLQLLAGIGCCIGTSPYIVADGARHHGRLFVAVVGPSARGRKGTSWANVRMVLDHVDPAWAERQIVSGLASGEGLINAVSDSDEDGAKPVDKRLMVREAEFARTLAACRREGSTLSAILRDSFDDGDLAVLTRAQPLRAKKAHISLVGHITPEELRAKLTDLDVANGLGNRFLFAAVQRPHLKPFGSDLDEAAFRDMGRSVRHAVEAARRLGEVTFAPEARDRWADLYGQMDQHDRHVHGLSRELTSRAEAHTLRLALLFALLDGDRQIGTVHLDAAWAVWNYSRESVQYLFGERTGMTKADRVLEAVRLAGGTLRRSECYRTLSNHLEASELDVIVDSLVGNGLIQTDTDRSTGGRPAQLLVIPESKAA